ncbi:PepSY domain-containing protein [Pseudoleptotrichia goodfellowii]|uniref:Peptidase propeptide and YPEB domain protein n=2 Tax=Pseudoleptotrichia goodfellowii TaxID=157692 RepID=D0GPW8_9FUSO|nr:PepSY domain-containing protein [Pseudoleptotrichia goodfellowii]EEY33864.1 peptidase propeptide and YPEB domain protein [Pseudoleptotrichia goodfellowii F0264]BBM36132.1 peptidase propeptide and YPEB domain protein [Pseudoleptotrichia goodfellowii]
MKNKMLITMLLSIIILGTVLTAATAKKKTVSKTKTAAKKREPQTTKIKYKKVVGENPFVTFVKAEEIALKHAGLDKETGDITKILMEQKDKELVYKIALHSDYNDYSYIIGSKEGKVLNYSLRSRDYLLSNKDYIGNDKVRDIILEKMPEIKDSDIYEIKSEKENNLPVYKVRVIRSGKEYKFIIDALKGKILKSEESEFTSL